MYSRLETVPRDVLQHIALLSTSSSTFDPPVEISRLLQTSSTIYRQLNVEEAPDLYARIFFTKFDAPALYQRCTARPSDSALAAELLNRYRLLRRVASADFSLPCLLQDLWTVLWMILESDGVNEQQLCVAGFPTFILDLSRVILVHPIIDHRTNSPTLNSIIVWLLCMSVHKGTILNMSKQDRDDLFNSIFPFIFLANKMPRTSTLGLSSKPPCGIDHNGHARAIDGELVPELILHGPLTPDLGAYVSVYHKQSKLWVPDPSTAAIHLAFVIYEATAIQIPHHLPENRAIADSFLRSGPTQEDFKRLASFRTPFLADILPSGNDNESESFLPPVYPTNAKSIRHDVQFCEISRILHAGTSTKASNLNMFQYIPGSMAGIWEGVYRTIDVPISISHSSKYSDSLTSMAIIKPMQCALAEYIHRVSPDSEESLSPDEELLDLLPDSLTILNDSELLIGGRRYTKYVPLSRDIDHTHDHTQRKENNPLYDVILLGETLDDHDRAWGAYKFLGRVKRNGLVILKREAKGASGNHSEGIWIFEGRLQFQTAFLGRWGITGASTAENLDHGIFSLGRTLEKNGLTCTA